MVVLEKLTEGKDFFLCLLIITLNNYIYNTTKTKQKENTLTRDINRVKQN